LGNEDSIIHTQQADQVAHFGGGFGVQGAGQLGGDSFRELHQGNTEQLQQQIQAEQRLTYNPFVDFPSQGPLGGPRQNQYENLATEQRVEDSDSELKNPTFNFEQNTLSHAKDKMRQSQEFHKLKLQQEKNKKIRDRLLDEIGQTDVTRKNLEPNYGGGDSTSRHRSAQS